MTIDNDVASMNEGISSKGIELTQIENLSKDDKYKNIKSDFYPPTDSKLATRFGVTQENIKKY